MIGAIKNGQTNGTDNIGYKNTNKTYNTTQRTKMMSDMNLTINIHEIKYLPDSQRRPLNPGEHLQTKSVSSS